MIFTCSSRRPSLVWFIHQRTTCPKWVQPLQKGLFWVKPWILLWVSLENHLKGSLVGGLGAWDPPAFFKHFLWGGAGASQHLTLSSLHPAIVGLLPPPNFSEGAWIPKGRGTCSSHRAGKCWLLDTNTGYDQKTLPSKDFSLIHLRFYKAPSPSQIPREKFSHPSSTSPKDCTCLSLRAASASSHVHGKGRHCVLSLFLTGSVPHRAWP